MEISSIDTSLPISKFSLATSEEKNSEEICLAAKFLSAERFKDERAVSATKWFDYRFMSPIEATQMFYDVYRRLFREAYKAHFDLYEAELKRGGPVAGLWSDGREFNGAWRARQIADGLGLPYEFLIREAIEASTRRGARRVPRPNQLYHMLSMPHIHERWAERRNALPVFSSLPQYRVEQFCDLPVQREHQTWVVGNLKDRLAMPVGIAQACFGDCVLPVERAETEFSSYQMEQVRYEGAGITPKPFETLEPGDFRPSCFGLPHAHDLSSPICDACHVRERCGQIEPRIRAEIAAAYGSEQPRDDEVRAQCRSRAARFRARKKAGASPELTSVE